MQTRIQSRAVNARTAAGPALAALATGKLIHHTCPLPAMSLAFSAILFDLPVPPLAVPAVLLMSGRIICEPSNIIRGGETNHIMATRTRYLSIFNRFTSLPHLPGYAKSGVAAATRATRTPMEI